MAHITQCPVCGGYTAARIHPECEIAKLSDLLYRVQYSLTRSPSTRVFISKKMRDEIEREKFISLEEYKKKKVQKEQKTLEKALHDAARQQAMEKARADFEREHPDPDPITFA
ncbi:MAG: hypothetical protein AAB629_02770 [Patescibacteria group bacterium]